MIGRKAHYIKLSSKLFDYRGMLGYPIRNFIARVGFYTFLITLSIILISCGGKPTHLPPTQTILIPTIIPNLFPTLTTPQQVIPTEIISPILDSNLYIHPTQLIQFYPIKDWQVNEGSSNVELIDPTGKGKISIWIVNTGIFLDTDSYERFIQAREENLFTHYNNYTTISWNIYPNVAMASISKSFRKDDVMTTVWSSYHQFKEAVYITDYWSDYAVNQVYDSVYRLFESTIIYDNQTIKNLETYASDGFVFDTGYYTITVPSFWTYSHRFSQFTVVDTFTSPDKHALVQYAVYDDGKTITLDEAGSFMRLLLRNYYAEDIYITSDTPLAGFKERLLWNSFSANYSGDSIFDVRETTFLLLTVLYDNDYKQYFSERLERFMDDYLNP